MRKILPSFLHKKWGMVTLILKEETSLFQQHKRQLPLAVLVLLLLLALVAGFQTVNSHSNTAQAKALVSGAATYTIRATVTDSSGTWVNKISVLSFDTAINLTTGGKPIASPITITKAVDADTPMIIRDVFSGKSLNSALFEFVNSVGVVDHSITISNVSITTFKRDVADQGKPEIETVAFTFTHFQYKQGSTVICFDFPSNKFC